jgi:hypothetical protein
MSRYVGPLVFAVAVLGVAAPAHAQVVTYFANMNGANEAPNPVNTPGTGTATVTYNPTLHTLQLVGSFAGLTSNTTQAHIHAATTTPFTGTAGVATPTPTFAGFTLGGTSGNFNGTLDLTQSSSYNAPFVTANGGTPATAEAALASALATGRAYFNIHTSTNPGGEIRGFLAVPEPGSLALTGFAALAGFRFLRRRGRAAEAPAAA